MVAERVSLSDNTLIASYAENIQRYDFALPFSKGKRVLDAGCGSGYGAHFLAINGARDVLALDYSEEAIDEANQAYRSANLRFERRDIEALRDDPQLREHFDVLVNFENVAQFEHPERFIEGVAKVLSRDGTFLISTPNGEISPLDEKGRPAYRFHHRVYTAADLKSLVAGDFAHVSLYGQWVTHQGMLRRARAKELFDQLCEAYYNPMSKLGRVIKRIAGGKVTGPPRFRAGTDSYAGDFRIEPLAIEPVAMAANRAACRLQKVGGQRPLKAAGRDARPAGRATCFTSSPMRG